MKVALLCSLCFIHSYLLIPNFGLGYDLRIVVHFTWCWESSSELKVERCGVPKSKDTKVKVKFTLEHAMKDQRWSRGIALLFL